MAVTSCSQAHVLEKLALQAISPNPAQPRQNFPDEALNSLAESIKQFGLLSPLLVRRIDVGKYELIAGERRYRALKKLGRTHADALIITAFDTESALMALIENIQREQLHYLDEASACRAILDTEGITQEELARKLGRSPSALANRLRLLNLSPAVHSLLRASTLTERHARALLGITDPDAQLETARLAADKNLTVRQLEQRISDIRRRPASPPRCIARDHRLYVNAVINTVNKLRAMGVPADASVSETAENTVISITLRKNNP